ncbi:MAG: putative maturation protein [Pepevirus faecenecus]|uniref:Maturation protein n=1 Tax=Leviviridae sp. TaxID=2027243 RepID=A0ABY3SSP4_9VIRU|nr:MAG: putative maturation protein [Leviviridae sp.]
MIGTWTDERRESSTAIPTPCAFSTKTTVFGSGELATPPKDQNLLTKAPLVKGDHLHAEPYWSAVDERLYHGSGRVPFSWIWYNEPAAGFPISSGCGPTKGGGITEGAFSVWQYLPALPASAVTLPAPTPANWKFLQEMADTKARAALNKALVNLPLLFAERKQTMKMIGSRVRDMGQLALAAQKRDLTAWKKAKTPRSKQMAAKDAANGHLELIFGFLPLIDEIEGAAEFLGMPQLDFIRARGLHGMDFPEVSLVGVQPITWPWNSSSRDGPNNAGNLASIFKSGLVKKRASVRTALRFELETQLAADARRLGFEPIGAAFDLYPLSFLVGWFSNLDSYIKGLAPLIGVEFVTGSRNRRTKTTGAEATAVAHYPTQPLYGMVRKWTLMPKGENVTTRSIRIMRNDRSKLTAPPELTLHWDVDVGMYEVAAGLSLLIQRYIKPLKRLTKQKSFRYRGPKPKWLADIRYRKV